jgi:Fe-S oxidoreductase
MSEPKYPSLEEYYNDIARQAIEECTLCGECVRNCPILPLTPVKDKAPQEIMEKVINFLKGEVFSEEVFYKAFSCASCRVCTDSCSQGINALQVFEAARIRLANQGKLPEAVHSTGGIASFGRTLSALQMKSSEARWLRRAPSQPERTENVVFTGCNLPQFPHTIFAFLDILERMGVDFVTLSGGELCCGFPLFPAYGKVRESEEKSRELVASLKAFSPKRVILICAGCYHQINEFYPKFLDLDFEVQFYSQFLNEHLAEMSFTKPLEKTVIFHDSCMSRRAGVNESVKTLLENIPGLKVVKAQNICCGGTPQLTAPQITQRLAPLFVENLAEQTIKTGADYLVNLCQICRMTFYPSIGRYSFSLKDVPNLINDSMGGREYEDKWEKYARCKSVEEVIEKSRDNFEANGLTEEEVRKAVTLFYSFP